MKEGIKRLFFGIEVHAPWPSQLPPGRLLDEAHRHLTLAFLGNIPFAPLQKILEKIPHPALKIGAVGHFDACLSLPKRHPHVIAWHTNWLTENSSLAAFQTELSEWLLSHGYSLDQRPWNPHVTLCRQPFNEQAWQETFIPIPFYASSIHLYESTGELHYTPIWSHLVKAPFEEINHMADMAFIVRGENLKQIYHNAFTALAFKAPDFVNFFNPIEPETLDDVIMALNDILMKVDSTVGSPMKAVSFHGEIVALPDVLQWEMIVDV